MMSDITFRKYEDDHTASLGPRAIQGKTPPPKKGNQRNPRRCAARKARECERRQIARSVPPMRTYADSSFILCLITGAAEGMKVIAVV